MNQNSLPVNSPASGPRRVSFAFRVGVVGHRPNRLKKADEAVLMQRLREILQMIQAEILAHHSVKENADRYDGSPPQLRALSPLAEGVDRMFAAAALDTGYTLSAVLPFHREEYERDFAPEQAMVPNSLAEFEGLLNSAKTVFELDGSRGHESYAYQIAGEVVLNQSDVLVVVWDGERRNLRGGTEAILDAALARGIPVVWIDAKAPHHWRLLTDGAQMRQWLGDEQAVVTLTESSAEGELRGAVKRLVQFPEPPAPSPHGHKARRLDNPRKAMSVFLREKQARYNPAFLWKWFRNGLGDGQLKPPAMSVTPYEEAVSGDWPRATDHPVSRLIDRLRPYYAWPDKLADHYADAYRSAFVLACLLAALAVAFALAPVALSLEERNPWVLAFAGMEFLAMCLILFVVLLGGSRSWHQRWLDYRLLAEIIRHQRLVAPLGGLRATPAVPAHWSSYGNPATSWMGWYARALERSLELPGTRVDSAYLDRCLEDIRKQLQGQVDFHQTTKNRSERIEHRLHMAELVLFGATLACCGLHILGWFELLHLRGPVLTFFCGVFPAVGAALVGINHQGEFRRIAQQSRSMAERLQLQVEQLKSLSPHLAGTSPHPKQLSAEIANAATDSARIMVTEVLGWRVIFLDHPLKTT